ncbi:thioredoxin domain-containing protein 17 [Eurytemora carolleeae]|uniref:thioredoxin domain-containing protein 17 n=1 Tax=Eurytemora carolleeae TaxID=1294199 RepID=UPI000C793AD1|nr:thioredoxin domain-containing protein 17 [Eurytemora carolleeae]|eukprot:XP_023321472.1 thioredoxin domain-containing protein 17-like [Eurytemora affinis]
MVQKFQVEGYEAFKAKVEELAKGDKDVFVLFSGSKDSNGESWCPDCVVAYPVIQDCLKTVSDEASFLYVEVGDRTFWKDPKCIFRTETETKLKSVPTLVKWGTPERLEEGQCADRNLVNMLFEE